MKRNIVLTALSMVLLFASCKNDNLDVQRKVNFEVNPHEVISGFTYEMGEGELESFSSSYKLQIHLLIYDEMGYLKASDVDYLPNYQGILKSSLVLEDGEYTLQADFTPTNPLSRTGKLRYGVAVNGKAAGEYNTVPNGYRAGVAADKTWSQGVLDHRRSCTSKVSLKKGVNEITILLKDPGLVPAKLYLYTENPPTSYFGMPESKRK